MAMFSTKFSHDRHFQYQAFLVKGKVPFHFKAG
jgi:hypothetical protein